MSIKSLGTLRRPQGRRGFTLIELLTVIAIIAILAAILYPVMTIARQNARKGHCQNNLRTIVQALKMYYDDWGVYPDSLMGVEYGPGASWPGAPYVNRLNREYVKDENAFTCPEHPSVLRGSSAMTNPLDPRTGNPLQDAVGRLIYYQARDSYDMQQYPNHTVGNLYASYMRKWSTMQAGLADNPRQLIYRNSPDSTVISWCMYHSRMNAAGVPEKNGMAVVAFLSGRVQDIPADRMLWTPTSQPWLVNPKP